VTENIGKKHQIKKNYSNNLEKLKKALHNFGAPSIDKEDN
jgi:hypothetical protein